MTDSTGDTPGAVSDDGATAAATSDGLPSATADTASGDGPATIADATPDDDAYGGIVTAFPYAFRASDSLLFKAYTAISSLFTVAIVLLFTFAVVTLLGSTASASGGSFTFSRAFFIFLMFLVVAPLVAPVLFVARRHRRTGSETGYDRALATTGFGFLAALYVSLVITTPADLQEDPGGVLGPVVDVLYGLPTPAAAVPPVLAAALIYLTHRWLR